MAELLKGKPVADAVKAEVASRIRALGASPCLTTLRVGDRADDVAYERSIEKAASVLGISLDKRIYGCEADTNTLLSAVDALNSSAECDGIMLFRPLPKNIDEVEVCNSIKPSKDVDGVSAASLAGVFMGEREGFAPATAEACVEMLDFYGIPLEGKRVAVVGRSLVIGKPVGMLLLDRNATVTYCHSRTSDLRLITKAADIVICAVGRPRFFDSDYFCEGQAVLDVGINDDGSGGLCGDVDFDSVEPAVAAISPVPGGIGSVSTSVLLRHVAMACEGNARSA